MSFLTQTVSIPVWLLILMLVAIIPLLLKLVKLLYRFKQGNIVKEEESDMVVWKIKSNRGPAKPKNSSTTHTAQKKQEEKEDLVGVLKVLLKEGEKGVRLKTISDQLGVSMSKVQNAINKLVEREMVEEVVGMSGPKFYLTQLGAEYCRRKTK